MGVRGLGGAGFGTERRLERIVDIDAVMLSICFLSAAVISPRIDAAV